MPFAGTRKEKCEKKMRMKIGSYRWWGVNHPLSINLP
jgi:hypothetical protein